MKSTPRRTHRYRGVGLVELLIALALGLIVSGAVFGLFITSRDSLRTTENLARIHDDMRVIFELLARDVREAGGTPCGTSNIANVLNNANVDWWANWSQGTLIGYTGTTIGPRDFGGHIADRISGTDAILIRRTEPTYLIITEHNPASAQFKVNRPYHGVKPGDIMMACDDQSAAIFQVSNSSQSSRTIVHNAGTGDPGNCTKDLGFPTHCTGNRKERAFATGGLLARVDSAFWYIGNNPVGGRSLYRLGADHVPLEMARNVTHLQLRYLSSDRAEPPNVMNDYTSADGVNDWNSVVAVEITFNHDTADAISTARQTVSRQTRYRVSIRNREYLP
ncbi:MAG: prepilin-type N-terminal cleavage/methylation domain-containing protein [Tepidimonas sp.]|uniref:prepilin-type N-terminal cleavage/methylation domain-containing protein n=1 Tax=Tepidimonas sp. TaxID=2002775 RepID=UPI0040551AC2